MMPSLNEVFKNRKELNLVVQVRVCRRTASIDMCIRPIHTNHYPPLKSHHRHHYHHQPLSFKILPSSPPHLYIFVITTIIIITPLYFLFFPSCKGFIISLFPVFQSNTHTHAHTYHGIQHSDYIYITTPLHSTPLHSTLHLTEKVRRSADTPHVHRGEGRGGSRRAGSASVGSRHFQRLLSYAPNSSV